MASASGPKRGDIVGKCEILDLALLTAQVAEASLVTVACRGTIDQVENP